MELHQSQIFLNYVTATGLILGGLFAAWKWGVAEILRYFAERRREIDENPDLEGTVEVKVSKIAENRYLLAVESKWRNHGARNVFLNTKETQVTLHPVDLRGSEACEWIKVAGCPILTDEPYGDLDNLRIGAGAGLTIRRHVLIGKSGHLMVRVMLVRREKSSRGNRLRWTAETLVSCDEPVPASKDGE